MAYLDLDELEAVFAQSKLWSLEGRNIVSFRRQDYLGDPDADLKQAVLDQVENQTGDRPDGSVRILTHLRYFGHCFNPVTIYYCFSGSGQLHSIVAEITNTPWQERHRYVLPTTASRRSGSMFDWSLPKSFHVSPFMELNRRYRWRFDQPSSRLVVQMEAETSTADREFDATLVLQRRPLSTRSMRQQIWRFPALTMQILLRIHIQAARLWFKKVPIVAHPNKKMSENK